MRDHYTKTFEEYGSTARGVDWGAEADVQLRYQNMLNVLNLSDNSTQSPSLLDVGCGYGGLYHYANAKGVSLQYTGVDLCENMLTFARNQHPDATFLNADFLDLPVELQYDYVVCNGILTQKLALTTDDMTDFANTLIHHMFKRSRRGVAFNVMTTHVNFRVDNLYYRDPAELLSYCLSNITRHVKLDHAYRLYEYTVYLYHE